MSFGEDRLFNYDYLMHCGKVETSSIRMFRYMQRNSESASKRSFPDYFETIMKLHLAKMDCFLTLSGDTTRTEKRAFRGYDLSTEVCRMIDRFDDHPQEKYETLPKINRLLFGTPDDIGGRNDRRGIICGKPPHRYSNSRFSYSEDKSDAVTHPMV